MNSLKAIEPLQRGFTQIKTITLMALLWVISFIANATDLQASMQVQPDQCVAMQQGQPCYVSVALTWQVQTPGNYCLHIVGKEPAINCWQNSNQGEFQQAFTSKVNLAFALRRQDERQALATAVVKMAWVHKKKGQARKSWRLF